MKMKKLYRFTGDEDYGSVAIVEESFKEAKKVAYGELMGHSEWIDLRGRMIQNVDVSKLPMGSVDLDTGLITGIYGWVEDWTCPKCNNEKTVYANQGNPCCADCGGS